MEDCHHCIIEISENLYFICTHKHNICFVFFSPLNSQTLLMVHTQSGAVSLCTTTLKSCPTLSFLECLGVATLCLRALLGAPVAQSWFWVRLGRLMVSESHGVCFSAYYRTSSLIYLSYSRNSCTVNIPNTDLKIA